MGRGRRYLQRHWLAALGLALSLGCGLSPQPVTSEESAPPTSEWDEALRYCEAQSIQGPLRLARVATQRTPSWALRMQLQAHLARTWRHLQQFQDSASEVWVCDQAERLALVNADRAGSIEIFDATTFERVARVARTQPLGRCSLSGDGLTLACPGHDGQLRLLRLSDGKSEQAYQHSAPLLCAALEREQRQCLLGDDKAQVLLWDLSRRAVVARWNHSAPLSFALLSADGQRAVSADQAGLLQHWQLRPLKKLGQWTHPAAVMGLAYNAQGIWVACENGRIYRNQIGRPQEILIHGAQLEGIQGLTGGRFLSFGGKQARLWSGAGELLQEYFAPSPIRSCRWSEASRRIALGCVDGTIRVLNAETGEVCLPGWRRPGEIRWVYLREERQQLYCRSSVVEVWDLQGVESFPVSLPVGSTAEDALWSAPELDLGVLTRQQLQLWDSKGYPRGRPVNLGGRAARLLYQNEQYRVHFPAHGLIQTYAPNSRGQLQLKDRLRVLPQLPLSPSGEWALRFDEESHQLVMQSLRSDHGWKVAQESAAQRLIGGALADDGQSLVLLQSAAATSACSVSLFRKGSSVYSRNLPRPFWSRFNAQGQLLYAWSEGLTLFDHCMKERWKIAAPPVEKGTPFYLADLDQSGRQLLLGNVHELLWLDAESGKILRKIKPVGRLVSAKFHPKGELVCTVGTKGAHLYRRDEDGGRVPLSELSMYTRVFFHPSLPLLALQGDRRLRVHSYAEMGTTELAGLSERIQQRLGRSLDGQVEVLNSIPSLK